MNCWSCCKIMHWFHIGKHRYLICVNDGQRSRSLCPMDVWAVRTDDKIRQWLPSESKVTDLKVWTQVYKITIISIQPIIEQWQILNVFFRVMLQSATRGRYRGVSPLLAYSRYGCTVLQQMHKLQSGTLLLICHHSQQHFLCGSWNTFFLHVLMWFSTTLIYVCHIT